MTLRVLGAGAAMSLAFASPAAADSATYLHLLQPSYTSLSTEQLLSEGMRVCSAMASGINSPRAVQMVQDDLGVSIPASGDIVSAAVLHLC